MIVSISLSLPNRKELYLNILQKYTKSILKLLPIFFFTSLINESKWIFPSRLNNYEIYDLPNIYVLTLSNYLLKRSSKHAVFTKKLSLKAVTQSHF